MTDKTKSSWFERWFQEDYMALYPNRNAAQAESQVNMVLGAISDQQLNSVLDLGCGSGRHLKVLQSKLPRAFGMDLSPVLLNAASESGAHSMVRGDFRHLPFQESSFDLVCSFFSSFGYLATREDDWEFFHNICSLVRPGGYLFLDLPNGPYTVSHLPPDDVKTLSSGTYTQKRRWDGECVRKRILIERPDGSEEKFEEQLRLFSYSEVKEAFESNSFEIVSVFGDEHGAAYDRNALPRMSFLVQKKVAL